MRSFTKASKAWVACLTAIAVVATWRAGAPHTIDSQTLLAFVLLGGCAAIAHLFPIRSARGEATYTLTNVFLIAGAASLPPSLLTALAVAALTPERWTRRGKPGLAIGWLFNVSQSAIALHAAGWLLHWAGTSPSADLREVAVLIAAAAVFTIVQDLLVGVVISLQTNTPIFRTAIFAVPALLSDGLLAALGVIVARIWQSDPALLGLVPPLLIMVFRMTRTAHLAHLAELDAKTGAFNYRHFERVLEDELARSRRVNRPLAILFADLDHFKQVNDRLGHTVGDLVLFQTANLITSTLRKSDTVARFGGEEFVALLPGTDTEEALYLAERLRAAVEHHTFLSDDEHTPVRCTVSVGVATFPGDGVEAADLMKLADEAVYQAKRTRNAVGRPTDAVARPSRSDAKVATSESAPTTASARRVPWQATLLIASVVAGGALMVAKTLLGLQADEGWADAVPFIALALAAEFFGVRIYETGRDRISFSLGIVTTMVTVIALPVAAPLAALAGALLHLSLNERRGLRRTLFNLANPPLATGAAVFAYQRFESSDTTYTLAHVLAALAATLAFYLFNSFLVWVLITLNTGRSMRSVLAASGWSIPINILLGLTGAFLGGAHDQLGLIGTLMFVVPVLMLRLTLDLYAHHSQKAIQALRALNGQLEAEIKQRKRFEESLEHQATHDPLTDFPNRSYLLARLKEVLQETAREPAPFALLLVDLDRFKEVNDTFGHHYGDLLLLQVGQRLRDRLRKGDTIARLGGDEFGVLLPKADAEAATSTARLILDALQQPLVLENQELEVDASIGIALCPEHGLDADVLMRRADVAMYIAKRGHSRLAIYDPATDHHSPARLQLVGDLRRAIAGEGLVLHYQPKASLGNGGIDGAEVLVRWQHPLHGMLAPDEFIPLAEHTGLIRALSRRVLNDALKQCREWQDQGLALTVAVNLSTRDLQDPQLPETVSALLARWQVAPERLQLEITEGSVMADAERAIEILGRLRTMGVQSSVDDFGTGYASLGYLKRLPVSELKIDRSFVQQMSEDTRDAAIVRSTIALAHDLGLIVVAEGVEDASTWDMLRRSGCDQVQGFYLSPALDAARFAEWLHGNAPEQAIAA